MNKSTVISAAITGLILATGCTNTPSSPSKTEVAQGECHGMNACKGKGECGGKGHACAGKNSCKGMGWIKSGEKECEEKGGTFKAM